jgi:hypothetical protein
MSDRDKNMYLEHVFNRSNYTQMDTIIQVAKASDYTFDRTVAQMLRVETEHFQFKEIEMWNRDNERQVTAYKPHYRADRTIHHNSPKVQAPVYYVHETAQFSKPVHPRDNKKPYDKNGNKHRKGNKPGYGYNNKEKYTNPEMKSPTPPRNTYQAPREEYRTKPQEYNRAPNGQDIHRNIQQQSQKNPPRNNNIVSFASDFHRRDSFEHETVNVTISSPSISHDERTAFVTEVFQNNRQQIVESEFIDNLVQDERRIREERQKHDEGMHTPMRERCVQSGTPIRDSIFSAVPTRNMYNSYLHALVGEPIIVTPPTTLRRIPVEMIFDRTITLHLFSNEEMIRGQEATVNMVNDNPRGDEDDDEQPERKKQKHCPPEEQIPVPDIVDTESLERTAQERYIRNTQEMVELNKAELQALGIDASHQRPWECSNASRPAPLIGTPIFDAHTTGPNNPFPIFNRLPIDPIFDSLDPMQRVLLEEISRRPLHAQFSHVPEYETVVPRQSESYSFRREVKEIQAMIMKNAIIEEIERIDMFPQFKEMMRYYIRGIGLKPYTPNDYNQFIYPIEILEGIQVFDVTTLTDEEMSHNIKQFWALRSIIMMARAPLQMRANIDTFAERVCIQFLQEFFTFRLLCESGYKPNRDIIGESISDDEYREVTRIFREITERSDEVIEISDDDSDDSDDNNDNDNNDNNNNSDNDNEENDDDDNDHNAHRDSFLDEDDASQSSLESLNDHGIVIDEVNEDIGSGEYDNIEILRPDSECFGRNNYTPSTREEQSKTIIEPISSEERVDEFPPKELDIVNNESRQQQKENEHNDSPQIPQLEISAQTGVVRKLFTTSHDHTRLSENVFSDEKSPMISNESIILRTGETEENNGKRQVDSDDDTTTSKERHSNQSRTFVDRSSDSGIDELVNSNEEVTRTDVDNSSSHSLISQQSLRNDWTGVEESDENEWNKEAVNSQETKWNQSLTIIMGNDETTGNRFQDNCQANDSACFHCDRNTLCFSPGIINFSNDMRTPADVERTPSTGS